MYSLMFSRARAQVKIAWLVACFDGVDVVHDFAIGKRSANSFRHDDAVLKDVTPAGNVESGDDMAAFCPVAAAVLLPGGEAEVLRASACLTDSPAKTGSHVLQMLSSCRSIPNSLILFRSPSAHLAGESQGADPLADP